MKIRKIKIKNYKIFDDLELDFTDSDGKALDTIVLAGINGSGKTSILQLLQKIFSETSNSFKIQTGLHEFEKEKNGVICDEVFIEFEASLEFVKSFSRLIIDFKQQASKRKYSIQNVSNLLIRINKKLLDATKNKNKNDKIIFNFSYKLENKNGKFFIQLNDFFPFAILSEDEVSKLFNVVYFVASSFEIKEKSLKNKDIFEIVSENKNPYEQDGVAKLVDIFSHKKEIEGYLVNSIVDAVLENRETTVKDAVDNRIKEVNNILTKISLKTKLVNITSDKAIFKSFNEREISIEELSSGEKQLYYRAVFLSKLNIQNSLILVDEPENSLHPTWQREIIKLYQNAGENNQVILATHSPHIISSVNPKNLFVLYFDEETNKVRVMNMEKEQKYTKGVEPNRILAEIMGYKLRDEDTQNRIDEITLLFRESLINVEEIEKKIESLAQDLGLHDPAIMGFNNRLLLIKRKLNQ
jgi:predicted ATP-binding protein involved in virulence